MKIIGSVLVTGALAIVGFYAMLFAAISGHGQFYMPFVITVVVLVAIFSNLAIWGLGKNKWFKISFLSFISLSVISVGIFGGEAGATAPASLVPFIVWGLAPRFPISR